MTIRHLKVFVTVAEEGSMSGAAKKLYVSQPSVSQAVSELEKRYQVLLFERLSQKLYLTKEGKQLLSYARHILDSFDQMEEAMNRTAGSTTLSIGCSVSVGTCLINDILDMAKEELPECEISVVVANSSEIERLILNNEVDFGVVEGILKSSDLLMAPVCEDELVLVCGKSHPLAEKSNVTLEMLQGENYISRESGSADRNQLERIFEEHGLELKRSFCSTNTEAIKNAVIRGRGFAVLSHRVVEREVKEGSIAVIPLEGTPVKRTFRFAMHKNKFVSETLKKMQALLMKIED